MEGEDGVLLIVLAGQEGLEAGGLDPLFQFLHLPVDFGDGGLVVIVVGQLDHDLQVVIPGAELFVPLDGAFECPGLFEDLLGFLGVVPEPRLGRLLLQLLDLDL